MQSLYTRRVLLVFIVLTVILGLVILIPSGKGEVASYNDDWYENLPARALKHVGEDSCPLTVRYGYRNEAGDFITVLEKSTYISRDYDRNLYTWDFDEHLVNSLLEPELEVLRANVAMVLYPYSSFVALRWEYISSEDFYSSNLLKEEFSSYYKEYPVSFDSCLEGGFSVWGELRWGSNADGWNVYGDQATFESGGDWPTYATIQIPELSNILENLDYLLRREVILVTGSVERFPGYGSPTGSFSIGWGGESAVQIYDILRSLPGEISFIYEDGRTSGTIEQDFSLVMRR